MRSVDIDVGRLEASRPTVRHGITGVHDEVDQDLARVGSDAAGRRVGADDKLRLLAHQASQHRLHVTDRDRQVQWDGRADLSSREGQQLGGQSRRPIGGATNRVHAVPKLVCGRQRLSLQVLVQELSAATDG
ncbi:MAG: hypothetical protein ABJC24_07350 [Chloroflexota bacterium]